MRKTRRVAASILVALALSGAMSAAGAAGGGTATPATSEQTTAPASTVESVSAAPMASVYTTGVVSPSLRKYKQWRYKTPAAAVSFSGTVEDIKCCFGTIGWANGYWRMGLRSRSETQFSVVTMIPKTDSKTFPYTAGVTHAMEFAINTKGYGMPATDATADFYGTLSY